MDKDIPRTQPPSLHQLTSAITEIHSSVQENCTEISALAQLALAAVHAPQEHHSQQALAMRCAPSATAPTCWPAM